MENVNVNVASYYINLLIDWFFDFLNILIAFSLFPLDSIHFQCLTIVYWKWMFRENTQTFFLYQNFEKSYRSYQSLLKSEKVWKKYMSLDKI